MPFPEVKNMFNRNDGCHEFIISKDAFKRLVVVHPSIVEHFPPSASPKGLDLIEMFVNQEEYVPTFGAGVKQLIKVMFNIAAKALIDHRPTRLWKNVFLYL
jgi:hypothetical protein